MKKTIIALLALLVLSTGTALAQANGDDVTVNVSNQKITITSKGHDIRHVLYDLFKQTDRNFVLDSGVRFVLYLNLKDVSFDEAFKIILEQGKIGYEVKNDIFYIGKDRGKNGPITKVEKKDPVVVEAPPLPKPAGKVTAAELQKRLTTRLSITDIRVVFAEFTKQTGIKIEVDSAIPHYKVDAFLINTSLKYALDVICDAAKLKYILTENKTIRVVIDHKE